MTHIPNVKIVTHYQHFKNKIIPSAITSNHRQPVVYTSLSILYRHLQLLATHHCWHTTQYMVNVHMHMYRHVATYVPSQSVQGWGLPQEEPGAAPGTGRSSRARARVHQSGLSSYVETRTAGGSERGLQTGSPSEVCQEHGPHWLSVSAYP